MPRTLVQCCPPLAPQVNDTILHVLLDVVPSGAAAPLPSVVGRSSERLAKLHFTARFTRASSRVSYTSLPAVRLPRYSMAPAFQQAALVLSAAARNSYSSVGKICTVQLVDSCVLLPRFACDALRERCYCASPCCRSSKVEEKKLNHKFASQAISHHTAAAVQPCVLLLRVACGGE